MEYLTIYFDIIDNRLGVYNIIPKTTNPATTNYSLGDFILTNFLFLSTDNLLNRKHRGD
jgi:hypothetical protein